MEIKKLSLGCNFFLSFFACVILFYMLIYYKPEVTLKTKNILMNL